MFETWGHNVTLLTRHIVVIICITITWFYLQISGLNWLNVGIMICSTVLATSVYYTECLLCFRWTAVHTWNSFCARCMHLCALCLKSQFHLADCYAFRRGVDVKILWTGLVFSGLRIWTATNSQRTVYVLAKTAQKKIYHQILMPDMKVVSFSMNELVSPFKHLEVLKMRTSETFSYCPETILLYSSIISFSFARGRQ